MEGGDDQPDLADAAAAASQSGSLLARESQPRARSRANSLITSDVADPSGKPSIAFGGRYRDQIALETDFVLDERVLGTGMNGPVRLATRKGRAGKYAVKTFSKKSLSRQKREELQSEVRVYLQMDHPHIARLEYVYEEEEELHLVMECMQGGELYDRLHNRKQYTEEDAAGTARQMLLAVSYLHNQSVVHRDLKLENFLYEHAETDQLKLIDFGFAKHWDHRQKMSRACGSIQYVAPEVLSHAYTEKADIWSLGVVTYMLLIGSPPFYGEDEDIMRRIAAGKPQWSRRFVKQSEMAQSFIVSLMAFDPAERPSAAQAMEIPWIKDRHMASNDVIDFDTVSSLRKFAHASHFRRVCLSMMAWSLSSQDHEELREQFESIDLDNSGTITMSELKRVLETNFSVDSHEAEVLFQRIDADNDHEIAYSEFLAATLQSRVGLHEDIIRNTFHRFDVDESGVITPDNLRELLGDSFEGCDVEGLISEADTNGDGVISYEEFIAYLHKYDGEETPKGVWKKDMAHNIIDSFMMKIASDRSNSTHSKAAHGLTKKPAKAVLEDGGGEGEGEPPIAAWASQDLSGCEQSP